MFFCVCFDLSNFNRQITGTSIIRYLARLHDLIVPKQYLCGRPSNILETTQVDFFIELACGLLKKKDSLPILTAQLNLHLQSRTFLVGHSLTVGDIAIFATLRSNARWSQLNHNITEFSALIRWYNHLASLMEQYIIIPEAKNKNCVIDLKDAEFGRVVTRFPPEPSGYLHIGHAKAALLNYNIAKQYGGYVILRFDDTNPQKENIEYVDNIINDLLTLGIEYNKLTHTSDYFDHILECGTKMLTIGKAYIDETPVLQMRKERMDGIKSKYRDRSISENLSQWTEMINGTDKGRLCVMRAKMDMEAKNKALRDPTLFRCNMTPHHRTGTHYKVYPTYDFACPVVDSYEGITHALRTTECHDR